MKPQSFSLYVRFRISARIIAWEMTSNSFLQRFQNKLTHLDKSGDLDFSRSRPVDLSSQLPGSYRNASPSLRPLLPPTESISPTFLQRRHSRGTPSSHRSLYYSRRAIRDSTQSPSSCASRDLLAPAYPATPWGRREPQALPSLCKASRRPTLSPLLRQYGYKVRGRLRVKLAL